MYSLSILFLDGGVKGCGGFGRGERFLIFVGPDYSVTKNDIQALTEMQLVLLQFRKTGHHQGVFEITSDQGFK
jgi:hypothetical protein